MKTKKTYLAPFTLQDIQKDVRYSGVFADALFRCLERLHCERVWLDKCFKNSGHLYESFYSPFNFNSIKEIVLKEY